MAKNLKIRKVILLGSGALKIGEAGEFDYSGSQAAKALKEEGIEVILINPNIASIQTSHEFVSKVYFLPVNPYFVTQVIKKEKPQGILLGFGGQTALNCGLALYEKNIFQKYKVEVLGTPVSAIKKTEDRLLFRQAIKALNLKVPESHICRNMNEVKKISKKIKYPLIVRAGYSLGGLGSGIARNKKQLVTICQKALSLTPQVLLEEYMEHWKEIEYEVVRDQYDNCITVCNMENFDPMGVHTGESIVVAPSQTLTNDEYHRLRTIAIKVVKSLPIIGECNIQYALDPRSGDYRIIEVNARLSRSSALASKATGYPLAYIAAKLAIGYPLSEIKNQVTKATSAFFEPSLDYIVVKIPRWDFLKFTTHEDVIGSEMQSVGEVMAIGRTFEEALQKAVRSLDLDYEGVISDELDLPKIAKNNATSTYKSLTPSPDRLYNLAFNLFYGQKISTIYRETGIDYWFLERIEALVKFYQQMVSVAQKNNLTDTILSAAKKLGFSDRQIAEVYHLPENKVRQLRLKYNIVPFVCQIDTLAGEFPAKTNYLYMSYHRQKHDLEFNTSKQIIIIGGGPYQIGSSVEFDWCAVNSAFTVKKHGLSPIMINCNPETVSTDYDILDKLYFEELTLERVLDIIDLEKSPLIVSVGGQIPNTLSPKLAQYQIKFLGHQPETIDLVEDREKFSALLDKLNINQPLWKRLKTKKETLEFARKIGYPVLIRPSYVLSGRAMYAAYSQQALTKYLDTSDSVINSQYPAVISKFIRGAKEVDFDAVSQKGLILAWAISEHVEHAGVHSGDATLVLPSFSLSDEAVEQIKVAAIKISQTLKLNGPYNIQFLVNEDDRVMPEVLVIEGNLRASRSFPFVSKVLGINFIELATEVMLDKKVTPVKIKRPDYTGVKVPHFSFTRLRKVDPVLRVEMASTGEVACFGDDLNEAYLKALLSTNVSINKMSALISLGGVEYKQKLLQACRLLHKMGYLLYATDKTARFLEVYNIPVIPVYKVYEGKKPSVLDIIKDKKVGLVINLSDREDLGIREFSRQETDGYLIRRASVDANIPLFTKATIANLCINSLYKYDLGNLKVKSWRDYLKTIEAKDEEERL
ncbi:carbamoyl phosphate synthase large subunit [Candidatus Gottesmanbacteria bacterium RBG_16_38_7b]|uniref:Carbamoyl phosphate synthase arginine-specific large chain n=1 Tax=Candidatus Gottesmanbacteria bacterium RBG_16_38_7b TaxID=1798372 RepID=A0A1F5YIS6_9BACT|nr:MAG: carbamoyl phosphate synthase large subunit [Candidatus Gottesmanbacteria bacterium RBG_16_38_7b]